MRQPPSSTTGLCNAFFQLVKCKITTLTKKQRRNSQQLSVQPRACYTDGRVFFFVSSYDDGIIAGCLPPPPPPPGRRPPSANCVAANPRPAPGPACPKFVSPAVRAVSTKVIRKVYASTLLSRAYSLWYFARGGSVAVVLRLVISPLLQQLMYYLFFVYCLACSYGEM